MKNPGIKTRVVHSESKAAWNVIGDTLGYKYKIARVPYLITYNHKADRMAKQEALEHAEFISFCFNHADQVIETEKLIKSINDLIS